ncbi:Uncharacterised protein [Bordetella pertussis]|nr:Uncharacterised protein [Bordetella pertussis]
MASRKITLRLVPMAREAVMTSGSSASSPGERTSMATATRSMASSRALAMNSARKRTGRLSMQVNPASSSRRRATDLPEPEMPVIRTTLNMAVIVAWNSIARARRPASAMVSAAGSAPVPMAGRRVSWQSAKRPTFRRAGPASTSTVRC